MLQRIKHIRGVKKKLSSGKTTTYWYHRHTGKRIKGVRGTEEFLANYVEAGHRGSRTDPTSFHYLVELYLNSAAFRNLAPRTQKDHRHNADVVLKEFKSLSIRAVQDKRIRQDFRTWREDLAERSPRQADYALAFLRRVLSFAYDDGIIGVNHATKLGQLYSSDRSDAIWEDEDILAFLAHAGPELALALRLALDTAQRQGDLIRLSWTQFTGNSIELRQRKGDKPVMVPCTELLRAELNRAERRAVTILTGQRGRPWTTDGFRTEWRKVSIASGVQGRLRFHDLRGTAVTRLAEAGCTVPEIATISGHSVDEVARILETYMARTNKMAGSAIAKLEDFRNRNK